jgi:hypothetical protein
VNGQLTLPLTSYQRPVEYVDASRRRPAKPDTVSRGELLLFRLVERLSRRGKPGCVRTFENLVKHFDKPGGGTYSERSAWTFWGTLVKLGWIGYRIFRTRGKQYLEFWPLVRVEEPAERIFLRRKTAPSIAPSTPKNCTVLPHTSDSLELSEGENDNEKPAGSVVALSPSASLPDAEALAALELLGIPPMVAMKIAKIAPASKVRRASEAVKAALARKGGNVIALAWTAVREGWEPSLPPATAPSDRREKPVRTVSDPNPPAPVEAPYIAPSADAYETLARLGLKSKYRPGTEKN